MKSILGFNCAPFPVRYICTPRICTPLPCTLRMWTPLAGSAGGVSSFVSNIRLVSIRLQFEEGSVCDRIFTRHDRIETSGLKRLWINLFLCRRTAHARQKDEV